MGGRLAPGMVLAAVAAMVLPMPADAASTSFKAKLPAAGGIAITQVKLKAKGRHPGKLRLRVRAKRSLPKDLTVVGWVRTVRRRRGAYIVRIWIARRAAKRARAYTAQSNSSITVRANVPGVTNLGVTGSQNALLTANNTDVDAATKKFCPIPPGPATVQTLADPAHTSGFKIKNDTGKRCTPGRLDFLSFFDALQADPPGPWSAVDTSNLSFSAVDVAVGDFNGDGLSDIVAAGDEPGGVGRMAVFFGQGDGMLGLPTFVNLPSPAVSVAAGDIDLDGLTDIAIGEAKGIDVVTGSMLQTGVAKPLVISSFAPSDVAIGDVNGDGRPDIVGGGQGGLFAFPGDGALHFAPEQLSSAPIVSLTLARINNDVFNDIVAITPSPTNANQFFMIGDLDGGASPLPPIGPFPGPPPRGLTPSVSNFPASTGAIDADTDMFVATGAGVEIFENQQPATAPLFTPVPVVLPAGTGPVGTLAVDVNNDNLLDVVTVNRRSGTVTTNLARTVGGYDDPMFDVVGSHSRAAALLDFGPDPEIAAIQSSGKDSQLLLLRIPAPPRTLPSPPTFTPPSSDRTIPPALIDVLIGSLLNSEPDVTRQAIVDITEWLKAHGLARHTPRAGQASVAVTQAGRITQFAIRGYGAQPSGTPIRFRVLRPLPDGTWVPVLTSKFVTLPPENGIHVYKTSDLDPAGADAFPVQPGDEIGVFQNADAPGHNPGDPTDWTIFSSQPGSQIYEVAHHNGFNNGDAETPATVDGLELLLQATVEPISCARSKTPYESCAAHLVAQVDAGGAAHVGQPLTIIDTVHNQGPADAAGVILTHGFPRNVTLGPLPAGCVQTSKQPPVVRCALSTIKWDVPQAQVLFTMTPTTRRPLVNSVRVFSTTPDPDPSAEAAAHAQRVFGGG